MEGRTSGMIGGAVAQAPRETREIESIIEVARSLVARSESVASRLHDMRRRLIGLDEKETDQPSTLKEVVSEIMDLRQTLDQVTSNLFRSENYIGDLERV